MFPNLLHSVSPLLVQCLSKINALKLCRQDEAWLEIRLHSTAVVDELTGTESSPALGRRAEGSSATAAPSAGQVKRKPVSHDWEAESADGPDEEEWLMPGSSNRQEMPIAQSGYETNDLHPVEIITICIDLCCMLHLSSVTVYNQD